MDIKPLNASMASAEMPIRVYFFERPDGSKIHVDEKSAWDLLSRPQQTITGRVKFKYLGTSDGRKYAQAVSESKAIFQEKGLEAAQEHLRKAWDLELESALLNKTPPRNWDTVDKNGQPVNMNML